MNSRLPLFEIVIVIVPFLLSISACFASITHN